MALTTQSLVEDFNAVYAYMESDEISLLLPYKWDFFGREVEKIISISASVASATFSVAMGKPAQFDSRIWISGSKGRVMDYFLWRQADATRCCLNGWAYWALRNEGLSAKEVTERLKGVTGSEKQELLFQKGTNFNDLPGWQKRGTGFRYATVRKTGFNPVENKEVQVERRVLEQIDDLPYGEEYVDFLAGLLES